MLILRLPCVVLKLHVILYWKFIYFKIYTGHPFTTIYKYTKKWAGAERDCHYIQLFFIHVVMVCPEQRARDNWLAIFDCSEVVPSAKKEILACVQRIVHGQSDTSAYTTYYAT